MGLLTACERFLSKIFFFFSLLAPRQGSIQAAWPQVRAVAGGAAGCTGRWGGGARAWLEKRPGALRPFLLALPELES